MVIFSRVLPTWKSAIQQISLGILVQRGSQILEQFFHRWQSQIRVLDWETGRFSVETRAFHLETLGKLVDFPCGERSNCHSVAASSFKHLNDEIPGRLLVALRSKDFSGSRMMTSRTMGCMGTNWMALDGCDFHQDIPTSSCCVMIVHLYMLTSPKHSLYIKRLNGLL